MKYIIMCGGNYRQWKKPKHLSEFCGEELVARTIRLLRENGVEDIAISTNNPVFNKFEIPILKHDNSYEYNKEESKGWWVDAFYPTDEPTCYIYGDVVFSPEAIKTIVQYETKDIELFGSMPPFAKIYSKQWIEPFALKVANTAHLKEAIKRTKELAREGKTWRKNPITWELWSVIKDTPLQTKKGEYIYNYTAINDYTTDVDDESDIMRIEYFIKTGGNMIKVEVVDEFTLGDFYKIKSSLVRKSRELEGRLYVGDTFICDPNMLAYLQGGNKYKRVVVKVIEVIPDTKEEEKTMESVTATFDTEKEPEFKVTLKEPKELTAEKPKKTRKRKNK